MEPPEPIVKFIRKRKTTASRRKDGESGDGDGESTVVRPAAKKAAGLSAASSGASTAAAAAAPKAFSFAASGTAASLVVDTSTRTLDVDGDGGAGDAAATTTTTTTSNADAYTGRNNYTEYVNKRVQKVTQSNAGGLRAGPLKAQTHLRISARFDYQQDVCKDYKDSGNCGYGDSCIYMHDRGDYKAGWQLDKEWEEQQKQKKQEEDMQRFLIEQGGGGDGDGDGDDEDDVPDDCPICHLAFKDPIVTRCKHYFCESCALKHFKTSQKCFECQEPTGGSFASAKELKVKLAEKRERIAEKEKEIQKRVAEQMGEDYSLLNNNNDDDDDD